MDDMVCQIDMGHLPIKAKFIADIGCVMSIKLSHVRYIVVELASHYRIPTKIHVGWHFMHKNQACHISVDSTPHYRGWLVGLSISKVTNPTIMKAAAKSPCISVRGRHGRHFCVE